MTFDFNETGLAPQALAEDIDALGQLFLVHNLGPFHVCAAAALVGAGQITSKYLPTVEDLASRGGVRALSAIPPMQHEGTGGILLPGTPVARRSYARAPCTLLRPQRVWCRAATR